MAENRKSPYPWLLIFGGVLLILFWLAGIFLVHPLGSKSTPTPATSAQVERVSLADAKKAYDAGSAIFVDVRDGISYEDSHIPGAVWIPLNDLANRLAELDPKSWIIPYCT